MSVWRDHKDCCREGLSGEGLRGMMMCFLAHSNRQDVAPASEDLWLLLGTGRRCVRPVGRKPEWEAGIADDLCSANQLYDLG